MTLKRRGRVRTGEDEAYRDLQEQVKAETREACQLGDIIAPLDPGHRCVRRHQGLHHLRKTGQGGARVLRANVMGSCNPCNDWVEDHPDLAREAGLVVLEGNPLWDSLGRRAARLAP